jgi:hypothetical protein
MESYHSQMQIFPKMILAGDPWAQLLFLRARYSNETIGILSHLYQTNIRKLIPILNTSNQYHRFDYNPDQQEKRDFAEWLVIMGDSELFSLNGETAKRLYMEFVRAGRPGVDSILNYYQDGKLDWQLEKRLKDTYES